MKLFRQYTTIVYNNNWISNNNSNKISTPSSVFVWSIGWLKTATNNHINDNNVSLPQSPPYSNKIFLAWYGYI